MKNIHITFLLESNGPITFESKSSEVVAVVRLYGTACRPVHNTKPLVVTDEQSHFSLGLGQDCGRTLHDIARSSAIKALVTNRRDGIAYLSLYSI